jgi:hypothetical protein
MRVFCAIRRPLRSNTTQSFDACLAGTARWVPAHTARRTHRALVLWECRAGKRHSRETTVHSCAQACKSRTERPGK